MPNLLNQRYPTINGFDPSWADIRVTAQIDGAPLLEMDDVASITASSTREVGVRKGASGGRIMGRTTGEVSHEFSWTLYRSGFRKLLRNLLLIAPVRGDERAVGLVTFNIHVQHTPVGSDDIDEYLCDGGQLLAWNMSHAEGTDADQVEVPVSIMNMAHLINGVRAVLL